MGKIQVSARDDSRTEDSNPAFERHCPNEKVVKVVLLFFPLYVIVF